MKYLKGNKLISHLFAISSILLAVACFTITSSFAFPDNVSALKKWSVYFEEVIEKDLNGDVFVKNNYLTVNASLNQTNNIYKFITNIKNDGAYDAKLSDINITDISNVSIGTSELSGITYYLSDYVDIYIKYKEDNKSNKVIEGNDLSLGDILDKNTSNSLIFSVKLKDESNLTEDQISVLNAKPNGNLNFSLSIGVNYIEKK
ncbi:MAG: hypothetical protein J1F35_04895 [Erysipelotrichales bacterium]|nr:hypothetical protein [Erysipelotrichales bacterium]